MTPFECTTNPTEQLRDVHRRFQKVLTKSTYPWTNYALVKWAFNTYPNWLLEDLTMVATARSTAVLTNTLFSAELPRDMVDLGLVPSVACGIRTFEFLLAVREILINN
jgi:hypothetical protein